MPVEHYSTLLPTTGDTRRLLLGKILYALLGIGGGGGGADANQIVVYTGVDPNTDGVLPNDITKDAIAYKQDGTGAIFGWDTSANVWR